MFGKVHDVLAHLKIYIKVDENLRNILVCRMILIYKFCQRIIKFRKTLLRFFKPEATKDFKCLLQNSAKKCLSMQNWPKY